MTEVLDGPRVRLRPLHIDDVPVMLAHSARSLLTALERADLAERMREVAARHPTLEEDGFWSLTVEQGDVVVGDIQARAPRYAFPPGVCEIGITLFSEFHGRGLGAEAVGLLTQRLHSGGWPRVQASTSVTNQGMRRVLEQCGYLYEGLLRSFAPGAAGREDYVIYASTLDELGQLVWPNSPGGELRSQLSPAPQVSSSGARF